MKDKLLKKYVDGCSSKEELREAIELLKSENISDDVIRDMRRQWFFLKDCENINEENIDFEAVIDKIHHEINLRESQVINSRTIRLRKLYKWVAVAAVFAFAVLAVYGVYNAWNKGIFRKESYYSVSSIRGQSTKISMPDGSAVWLNGESSVSYNSSFGVKNRNLKLTGEGFFSVQKNKQIPFIVEVGTARVTAVGTAFNIDALGSEGNVIVTMENGRVLIENKSMNTEIVAGQQAKITESEIGVSNVDYELFTSWRNGQIVFKNETLFTITSQLEKMYDVRFVYKSDSLKDFRYRGTIRLDNSVFKALEMLKLSTGIIYKVEGNRIILEK
jgi:transmembrane sensor